MSAPDCPTKNPLQRDGTSQYQRMLEALEPGYAPVHEFTLQDWMRFAWHYARNLNYYNTGNDTVPQSDWTNFLPAETAISSFFAAIRKAGAEATAEPHLALLVSFLQLMQSPQEGLNGLTKRHLDFYYKRVLQLQKKPFVPDRVHLVFELAKNIASHQLLPNALFDAGKDRGAKPKPLQYLIGDEPVFYGAKTTLYKTVYHQKGISLRHAPVANSYNGNGAALDKENPQWYAFGFDAIPVEKGSATTVSLPAAKPGFALASAIFLLKDGERKITVTLDFNFPAGTDYSAFAQLDTQLIVLLTGEKEWVSPATITVSKKPAAASKQLVFTLTIDQSEKAIVAYNSKLHSEHFNTDKPVMRILLEAEQDKGYKAYAAFAKATLKKATIAVAVSGMKDLLIENDDGKLDPAKPFLPFGAVPKKGSGFYLGSEEIFSKKWDKIDLHIEWKSKPDDLAQHYIAYKTRFLSNDFTRNSYDLTKDTLNSGAPAVGGDNYFKVETSYIKNNRWSSGEEKELFDDPITVEENGGISLNPFLLSFGFTQLYATVYNTNVSYVQNYLQATPVMPLFNYATFNPGYTGIAPAAQQFTAGTKNNFVRLKLITDFFHGNFPVLYAAAMTIPGAIIPKEPYTPLIASLTLDYSASVENDFSIGNQSNEQKLSNYRDRKIQLFHEAPFGQAEQHAFLKEQQPFVNDKAIYLVPQFTTEAEFYIGIKDLLPETILSVLFQVAEGSENPDSPSFDAVKKQEILWYILCNNEWKYLNDDFIISDDTNHFLRSGIIRFLIPQEATSGNTLLPETDYWLKAQLPEGIGFDSVCRFVEVLAQADEAVFVNQGNELSHLQTALQPGTISKMVNKEAAVKKVSQPYNSFGGRGEETDMQFYIRVSERLRHKNRAVHIWDYERLVLEKFPSVYKVKCLNHTSTDFELAPGSVRIIPIPDLRNKNIYDVYQPRVSKNRLSEIGDYLATLHGFHVDCKAENPEYEEVQFDFKVRFYAQYDPKAYVKTLEEELKKYLSPWAFDDFAELRFGGALYKSRVVAFIEERSYVDFITDFSMYNLKFGLIGKDALVADNSRAILTSAKEHKIAAIQPPVCP